MLFNIFKNTTDACGAYDLFKLLGLIDLICSFVLTFFLTGKLKDRLPRDGGRDFAVDGKKSAGKGRGAGIIFVLVFSLCTLLFLPLDRELAIYVVIIILTMFSGYLDDAAATPWGEYKKGLIDLVCALACSINFVHFNGSDITILLTGTRLSLPSWLFVILAVILIWAAINVVNCSDGVDGLSASMAIVTMLSFLFVLDRFSAEEFLDCGVPSLAPYRLLILSFVLTLLAYLYYNANPSILMMGDAGSRAMGIFIAILALKSSSPLLFIPLALVIILDGGLGLLKVSVRRFLKVKNFMEGLRLPLHDHVRKNISPAWSPTQVVFRFTIIHALICVIYIGLVYVLN